MTTPTPSGRTFCTRAEHRERGVARVLLSVVALLIIDTVTVVVALGQNGPRQVLAWCGLALFTVSWVSVVFCLHRDQRRWVSVGSLVGLTISGSVLALAAPAGQVYATMFTVAAVTPFVFRGRSAQVMLGCALAVSAPPIVVDSGVIGAGLVMFGAGFFFLQGQTSIGARRELAAAEASRAAATHAAAVDERARIARELHDVLAHTLSGLAVQVEGARLLAERRGGDPELVAALRRAHRLAASGLGEARRAVGALRFDDLPGPDRLAALVEESRGTGPPATLHVEGSPRPLSPAASVALYRTAQEALTNVRRHASADEVEVRLDWDHGRVRLAVVDRATAPAGRRFAGADSPSADSPSADSPSADSPSSGNGLRGMRERAELAGGTLRCGPTPTGWAVRLELPA